jgi:hypothetical protein
MIFAGDILLKLINGTNIFNELKKKKFSIQMIGDIRDFISGEPIMLGC